MSKRIATLVALLALLAAACGNAGTDSNATGGGGNAPTGTATATDLTRKVPVDQPGVTDTEIRVGGVVSKTNPLGGNYDDAFDGVRAYFEMINAQGGIYGRRLVLAAERDDQVVNNQQEVQALISQDKVFAILPVATLLFTGADLAATSGTPTFGWTINPEWAGPPNLFGDRGGELCFDCPTPVVPWLAKDAGAKKVAVLAYNVPQSKRCAEGIIASFRRWPTAEVAFQDLALSYGVTDFSVQVGKMKQAGVELVTTCMDLNGVTNLARELDKQQLSAVQYMPNAYDHDFAKRFADLVEGSLVLTWFAPFEVPDPPEGTKRYFEWIDRTGGTRSELSMSGWLAADLFYRGLVAAGPEFTQQKVIDAINTFDNWTADGSIPGVDWTIAHKQRPPLSCGAISRIDNGGFVPLYGEAGRPFICFDVEADQLPDRPEPTAGATR
ncbi:MAG: ABC transporter substrate-binding protein [Acidimicrobiales bacterium]